MYLVMSTQQRAKGAAQTFDTFPFRNEALEHFRALCKRLHVTEVPIAPATKRAGRERRAVGFMEQIEVTLDRVDPSTLTGVPA